MYLLAKIGVDTDENEPLEVWLILFNITHSCPYCSVRSFRAQEGEGRGKVLFSVDQPTCPVFHPIVQKDLNVPFVLREEFASLFQTFSRNDPPGKAPPSRGRYVF